MTASAHNHGTWLLAEWGPFDISQSLNFEQVFQRFLRQLEAGEKVGRYPDVFNMNMARIFLTAQIFVKRRSFESKCLFSKPESFKKELLIGKCFVTKNYVRSKKTENEEVLPETIFTFIPLVLKKRLFLTFGKFKILYLFFFFNPKEEKI